MNRGKLSESKFLFGTADILSGIIEKKQITRVNFPTSLIRASCSLNNDIQ